MVFVKILIKDTLTIPYKNCGGVIVGISLHPNSWDDILDYFDDENEVYECMINNKEKIEQLSRDRNITLFDATEITCKPDGEKIVRTRNLRNEINRISKWLNDEQLLKVQTFMINLLGEKTFKVLDKTDKISKILIDMVKNDDMENTLKIEIYHLADELQQGKKTLNDLYNIQSNVIKEIVTEAYNRYNKGRF